ncbi:MAG: beta-ketoacyl synthase chain length factor [Alphaproteobacteria bacterium]|nr:beta-ketoacyl synthase chain length factor [Alphaproteobacteria bacterium]
MIRITGANALAPGGLSGLRDDLLAARPRGEGPHLRADTPDRPKGVAGGAWRRMSRLSRMVAAAACPLLEGRDDLDDLAVVWASASGEVVPTARFLTRLFREGPELASPLAFQNSVYNAPAGHLSITVGLRGLSETLAAGGATGLFALLRGAQLIEQGRARAALVIAGEDLNETLERAWTLNPPPAGTLLGECVAAVLLERGGEGPTVEVVQGVQPLEGAPVLARATRLPLERAPEPIPDAIAPERSIGLSASMGLAAVVALTEGGGSIVDQDEGMVLTARIHAA